MAESFESYIPEAEQAVESYLPEADPGDPALPDVKGQKKKKKAGHGEKSTSYVCYIVLSCCVMWCCGFICGGIAFILAVCAQIKVGKDKKTAKRLARASLVLSLIGIAISILIIIIVIAVTFSNRRESWNCSDSNDHRVGDTCFKHRVLFVVGGNQTTECSHRLEPDGYVVIDDGNYLYCYYNCSRGLFSADGRCFGFRSDARVCAQFPGNDSYQTGSFCYHNRCAGQMHAADGKCYAYKSSGYSAVNCSLTYGNGSHHDGTFCYHNCSAGLVFVANVGCYRYVKKVAVLSDCTNYSRSYFQPPHCYYNCSMGLYSGGGYCFVQKRDDVNGDFCRMFRGGPIYFENSICYYNATSPDMQLHVVVNSSSTANVSSPRLLPVMEIPWA